MTVALYVLGAYLLGAIPFGVIIGRARGVDIRQHGSRNIGATNVGRVLGRKWGYLCLALDLLKGLGPTLAAKFAIVPENADAAAHGQWVLVAAATVIGHTFPVYLGFKGGKGVATTIGAALGLFPHVTIAMVVALIAYAAARYGTGIVSVGSLALAVVFPAALLAYLGLRGLPLSAHWPLVAVATVLGLLIIIRHRANIGRLLRGEEPRAAKKAQ